MKQIRKNCFETNSSSMHSLVITKELGTYSDDEYKDGIYLDNDGTWHIYGFELEFGRSPFRCLSTFESKCRYAIASLTDCVLDDEFVEIENLARKYVKGLSGIRLDETIHWREVKSEFNEYGVTEEELKSDPLILEYYLNKDNEWEIVTYDTGYVDENVLGIFLRKHKVSLEDFLTNKKYVVICDGDEYCIWEDLKRSGLIDKDFINEECCGCE